MSLLITKCSLFTLDFDECSLEPNPCDDHSNCINSDGSYSCICKQGFTGNGAVCEGMCQGAPTMATAFAFVCGRHFVQLTLYERLFLFIDGS